MENILFDNCNMREKYNEGDKCSEYNKYNINLLSDIYKNMTNNHLIGNGSYSNVYICNNFAVKYNLNSMCQFGIDPSIIKETTAVNSLNYPNIIKFNNIIIHKKDVIYTMEYFSYNLQKIIKHELFRDLEHRIRIFKEILYGVYYMHLNGFTHNDLKPQNILVSGNMEKIAICDFGLSKKQNRIVDGHEAYTIWYRAPELIGNKKPPTYATDIWALGCIFYEILFGCPLFKVDNETQTDILMNKIKEFCDNVKCYQNNNYKTNIKTEIIDENEQIKIINEYFEHEDIIIPKEYFDDYDDVCKDSDLIDNYIMSSNEKYIKQIYGNDNTKKLNFCVNLICSMLNFNAEKRPDINSLLKYFDMKIHNKNKFIHPLIMKQHELSEEKINICKVIISRCVEYYKKHNISLIVCGETINCFIVFIHSNNFDDKIWNIDTLNKIMIAISILNMKYYGVGYGSIRNITEEIKHYELIIFVMMHYNINVGIMNIKMK